MKRRRAWRPGNDGLSSLAGYFGVSIVAISADNVAVAEAQSVIGSMEGAVVKQAISFHAAATMTPEATGSTSS